MRPLLVLTVTFVLLPACNARSAATSSDTPSAASGSTSSAVVGRSEVTIPVEGMSCGACAARLKRGLKNVDGVLDVEVTLHPGAARIGYLASKTDPARLVAAINGLEFTAGAPSTSSSSPAAVR